jgi:hypothetical protein
MSDQELDLFIREARQMTESPQSLRKAVTLKNKGAVKPKKTKEKVDLSGLFADL